MKHIISMALGTIHRWSCSLNRNDLITEVKQLDISGFELTLATKEDLYNFRLTQKNKEWLKSLNYVGIHAPFKLIRNAKDENEVIKQLDIINEIYKDINAKNVIIHPTDIPETNILAKYDFKVSTENLPKKRHYTIPILREILKKHPDIGLCLDVAHAYMYSKDETKKLIKAFEDKITQVHLSATYKRKDHQSLRIASKQFIDSIQPIKELDVPIVIEEDIRGKNHLDLVKELEYVKRII